MHNDTVWQKWHTTKETSEKLNRICAQIFWKAVVETSYQNNQKLQILGCFTSEKISQLMSQIFLLVAIRRRSILTSLVTHKLYDTPEKHCVFQTWALLLENNVSNPLIVGAKSNYIPWTDREIITRRSILQKRPISFFFLHLFAKQGSFYCSTWFMKLKFYDKSHRPYQ